MSLTDLILSLKLWMDRDYLRRYITDRILYYTDLMIILDTDDDGYTDYTNDDDELLLVVIEKKVKRYKIMELFIIEYESIGLKNLFSMGLLISIIES
jgi:hypothetical protein